MKHVTVLSNMELKNAYPGTHATSNAAFLSAAKAKWTESSDYYLGTTVDQIAAQQMGQETQLPSLELAMDLMEVVGQCDNGYACVYQNNLSWSSPTTPLPSEAHPRVVFERLFGEGGSSADRRAALGKRASLLDWVREDIARLQRQLGAADRTKVDRVSRYRARSRAAHSEGRSADARQSAARSRSPGRRARSIRRPREADVRSAGARAAGRHHARHHVPARARDEQPQLYRKSASPIRTTRLSHHGGDPEKLAKIAKINQFHVSLFAYFLEKLDVDRRRRRHAARPFAVSVRQRHGQSRTSTTT